MPLTKKIIEAAKTGNKPVIEACLNKEKSALLQINDTDNEGMTLLHHAAENNQINLVEFLLAQNANVNVHTKKTLLTPLHYAAFNNNTGIMSLLLNKGAIINARKQYGLTPLHTAAINGSVKAVKLLIDSNADVNERDGSNCTALHKLCCCTNLSRDKGKSIARLLIEDGNANLDLTIPTLISGYHEFTYSMFTLSEYAQYHSSPGIADLIDEKKRLNAQKQLELQNKIAELQQQNQDVLLKKVSGLEEKVRHLEKKMRKLKAGKPTVVDVKDANECDANPNTLFGLTAKKHN